MEIVSHPVWVRGLKQYQPLKFLYPRQVAPRVGAWIETGFISIRFDDKQVAPRVGAWIETKPVVFFECYNRSHPVWVRGLKHRTLASQLGALRRTPCGCVD